MTGCGHLDSAARDRKFHAVKDTRPSGSDRCDRRPATRGFTPSCVSREHGRSKEEAGCLHFRKAEAAHRSPVSGQNGRIRNSAPCATTAHAQVFHVKHRLWGGPSKRVRQGHAVRWRALSPDSPGLAQTRVGVTACARAYGSRSVTRRPPRRAVAHRMQSWLKQ